MFKRPFVWIVIWLLFLSLGPITVLATTPLKIANSHLPALFNFLMRLAGLITFTLLFFQLIIGNQMDRLTEKLGGWVFNFHRYEGALIACLIVLHPVLFVFFHFYTRQVIDPFYVFTGFCVLCPNKLELYYTLGRIAFWFTGLAILAALVRTQPWWRKNWRKFHILNYVAFFLVAIHSFFAGTDIRTLPFAAFYWLAVAVITGLSLKRLFSRG